MKGHGPVASAPADLRLLLGQQCINDTAAKATCKTADWRAQKGSRGSGRGASTGRERTGHRRERVYMRARCADAEIGDNNSSHGRV